MNEFKERFKKGIFFIPTLLTMGNILCGFFAIIASLNGNWLHAGIAIAIAFLLDGLDGRLARLTDTESDFGLQLDSLADCVSFGVAPAALAYTNWLYVYERLGILLGFLFVCGAAMRLARFNAFDVEEDSMKYFNGLPTPAAAGVVVSLYFVEYKVFIQSEAGYGSVHNAFVLSIPIVLLLLSYLMLSNLRYPTFKNIAWENIHPFGILFSLLFVVFICALFPLGVYAFIFLGYLLTGFLNLGKALTEFLTEAIAEAGTD
ncbi:MAG: CDP-diacylglycerol--serine O-phosphatidyltransferase [bacterium]